MSRQTFLYAGNWAYSNLGCEAIVRGTTAVLREIAGESRFISQYFTEEKCNDAQRETDPSIIHRPFPFLKRKSLPWFQHQLLKRLFHQQLSTPVRNAFQKSLKDADAVLMLGGDTFSPDYGNSEVYFRLSSMAVEKKVPIAVWGASIGPFTSNPVYERWAVEKLRRISLLCVRETETVAYLSSLSLRENVILTADPSFFLQPEACELSSDIEMVLRKGCIGLNLSPLLQRFVLRESSSPYYKDRFQLWSQIAADIVKNLLHRFSQPVLLIPHVFSECGDIGRDDYLFLSKVTQQVQEPEGVYVLEPGLNAAQTKWVISRVRVFAGARTHSTLAAISTGVPTVCIGYSLKAKGIAKDVYGHQDWLIPGTDLLKNPSILCNRFESLLAQESDIRTHLKNIIPIFQKRARDGVNRFLEFVR